jgi:ribosomal protein L11 methyltransferase
MYLWRKLATARWLAAQEAAIVAGGGGRLAVIERPARKNLILEVVCGSQLEARKLRRQFGGGIKKLPRASLKHFWLPPPPTLLKIGRRLVITNVGGTSPSRRSRAKEAASRRLPRQGASHLVIPAGTAFGTGDHATTAMSLRLLEQTTRGMKRGWSVADLGTGSGILALAARRFGAGRVLAVDNDARALAAAKENARANKVGKIGFREADARHWRPPGRLDIIVANLFSELLIQTLPNLRRYTFPGTRLILSGILRMQERDVRRALNSHKFGVLEVRRRGKWIAILAGRA